SFFKNFYPSVTKSDYVTLRLGFIMLDHCRGNPKFNFHKYMIRALEADFKKVVGISWYLWLFVIVFLMPVLRNAKGGDQNHVDVYLTVVFLSQLLLAVGMKLDHVITQLAHEVAEKHVAVEGDLVGQPSDDHFWFHRPKIILILAHIILFNSFELAFFFFIWMQYGFDLCIMGKKAYIISEITIYRAFVQFLCSYIILPLYGIVMQMGSFYNKAIFDEPIQEGLFGWAKKARMNKMRKVDNGSSHVYHKDDNPVIVQLANLSDKGSAMEEGKAEEIVSE
ncbi:LOW QUALITY PROTEIN: Mlo domain-containing protein, partial [Cephalotus follicularis]